MSLQKQAETKLLPKPKQEYGSITSLLKNEVNDKSEECVKLSVEV